MTDDLSLNTIRQRIVVALVILIFPLALTAAVSIWAFTSFANDTRQILTVYQAVSGVELLPSLAQGARSKLIDGDDASGEIAFFDTQFLRVVELFLVLREIDPDGAYREPMGVEVDSTSLRLLADANAIDLSASADTLGLSNELMGSKLGKIWEADAPDRASLEATLNAILSAAVPLSDLTPDLQLTRLESFLTAYQQEQSNLLDLANQVRDLVREEGQSVGRKPIYFSAAIVLIAVVGKILIYLFILSPLIKRIGIAQRRITETERRVAHTQKQEALGKLVGGVAHDFNNLLAVIMANSEIIKGENVSPLARTCNEEIARATNMGASISRELLTIGRQAELVSTNVDAKSLLIEMELLLRRVLPAQITIDVKLDNNVKALLVDKSLLKTSLLNIAFNARDSMKAGGTLSLYVSNHTTPKNSDTYTGVDLADGDYVKISVQDTGTGMTPDVLSKAFDPFFTTKDLGEGTGMGLSMVQGFARQTGGNVNIQSSPDTGTLVEIYIPATTEMRTSKADGNLVSASSKRTGRTLLLVEDDDGVRRAIEMLLSRSGFDVTSAWDGATAMEYLKTNAAPDVLLTDLSMPGQLQGMDLARHVWKEMPQTSIVVMSGYAEETENDIGVPFLEKPVSQAALISTINNCLNDRARETQAH